MRSSFGPNRSRTSVLQTTRQAVALDRTTIGQARMERNSYYIGIAFFAQAKIRALREVTVHPW